MNYRIKQKQHGFTLIELSIVIIIIGLLISGIVSGDSLVEQAKLQSLANEITKYKTAYNAFKLTYNAIPGDMNNAHSFWTSGCTVDSSHCNGDGDGLIARGGGDLGNTVDSTEGTKAIKHLSLARLINFHSPELADSDVEANDNIAPIGPFDSMLQIFAGRKLYPNWTFGYAYEVLWPNYTTNALYFTAAGPDHRIRLLTPSQGYNIDVKLDDGQASGNNFLGAGTGKIKVGDGYDVTPGDCADQITSIYGIANKATLCILGAALD